MNGSAALERLISTPGGTNSSPSECGLERRGTLPEMRELPPPFCLSPDGKQVNNIEELPKLSLPKTVIIRGAFMLVDGWHFRIWPITTPCLEWLVRQACRWCEEDPSPENRAQINGVVEALETVIKKGLLPDEKQES